jgi:hypothetical protein
MGWWARPSRAHRQRSDGRCLTSHWFTVAAPSSPPAPRLRLLDDACAGHSNRETACWASLRSPWRAAAPRRVTSRSFVLGCRKARRLSNNCSRTGSRTESRLRLPSSSRGLEGHALPGSPNTGTLDRPSSPYTTVKLPPGRSLEPFSRARAPTQHPGLSPPATRDSVGIPILTRSICGSRSSPACFRSSKSPQNHPLVYAKTLLSLVRVMEPRTLSAALWRNGPRPKQSARTAGPSIAPLTWPQAAHSKPTSPVRGRRRRTSPGPDGKRPPDL